MRYGDVFSDALRTKVDETVLGYRYWMDEPGNDVQWYFSENHALLFHAAAYLSGHLLPDATFRRSGRSGAEQSAVGRDRVRAWLDHFERWEMAEFNSAPYFPIDLKGLTALFALAPDADIRCRAGCGISRLMEIVANSAHHGVLTAAQGRSYEHTLRAATVARALGDRPAGLGPRHLWQPFPRDAADGALPARPRSDAAARPRPTGRSATAPARRNGASRKAKRLRASLPRQERRLGDRLRRRAIAGSSGAIRRR